MGLYNHPVSYSSTKKFKYDLVLRFPVLPTYIVVFSISFWPASIHTVAYFQTSYVSDGVWHSSILYFKDDKQTTTLLKV